MVPTFIQVLVVTDLHKHFLNYSKYLFNKGCINENTITLDIGCNDGLFLNFLKNTVKNYLGLIPPQI